MAGSLLSILLLTAASVNTSTTAVSPNNDNSPVRTVTAGLLLGSSIEAELTWFTTKNIQLASSAALLEKNEGAWRVAADFYYHFPNTIGSVSKNAEMGFYVGLGAQLAGQRPDESVLRFGERVSFGLRYTLDSGKYEAVAVVAPGLLHRPRLRATLDALVGLRLGF
ncbi:MAG: hypothetical protein VYC39_02300 [Myxococcota bacterium]|nr:hypothetical protein [Myxococcota bacterium]